MEPQDDVVDRETARQEADWIPLARPILITPASDPADQNMVPVPPLPDFLLLTESRREVFFDLLLFVGILIVVGLGGEIVIGSWYHHQLAPLHPDEDKLHSAISRAALFPAIAWRTFVASVLVFWITKRRGLRLSSAGLATKRLWLNVLLGFASFVLIMIALVVLSLLITALFPKLNEEFQKNAEKILDAVPKASPLGFAAITLAIGFYEELIFRGFLMPRLRRATGSWFLAVVLTTVIFALLHLQDQVPAALLAISGLSLVFSVITIWRHSIIPAVIAHALWNLFMFLQLYYYPGYV